MRASVAKKSIILLPDLSIGGAEKFMIGLAQHLQEDGIEVTLCVIKKTGPLIHSLPNDLKVVSLSGDVFNSFLISALVGFYNFIKLLKRCSPDIIYSTLTGTNIFASCACKLSSINSSLVLREACSAKNINSGVKNIFARIVYRWADRIVAVSEEVKEDIKDVFGVHHNKVTVINNPVDVKSIRHESKQRSLYEKSREGFTIVVVGRLVKQKGFDFLLDVMPELLNFIECSLIIVGDGPERGRLERMSKLNGLEGRVTFVGAMDNPYPIMNLADVVAITSRWEGFPNVMLEAMALNKRIVATRCPGMKLNEELNNLDGLKFIEFGDKNGLVVNVLALLSEDSEPDYGPVLDSFTPVLILDKYKKLLSCRNP